MIGLLAEEVIDRWVGGMVGVGVGMLTELGMVVVTAAMIVLEVVMVVSCVGEVCTDACTGKVINNDVTTAIWVGAMMEVLIDLLADTIIGIVTDIGVDVSAGVNVKLLAAAMTDLEFMVMVVSLTESLCFCSAALNC